ncbi:hypothetical protein TI05_14225, partial [Achromatium sp. WMS3]
MLCCVLLIDAQEQKRGPVINLKEVEYQADIFLGKVEAPAPSAASTSSATSTPTTADNATDTLTAITTEIVSSPSNESARESLNESHSEASSDSTQTEIHNANLDTPSQTADTIAFESAFEDLTLRHIFELEAQQHLKVINNFIDTCKANPVPWAFDEQLSRAFHTLSGSAHMAGIPAIARLAKALERKAVDLLNNNIGADNRFLNLTIEGANSIENIIQTLEHGEQMMPDTSALVERVTAYTIPEPASTDKSDSGNNFNEDFKFDTNFDFNQSSEATPSATTPENSKDPFDIQIDTSFLLDTPLDTKSSESTIETKPDLTTETTQASSETTIETTIETAIEEEFDELTGDEEARAAFLEEAQDQLDTLNTQFQEWVTEPDNTASFKEIMRVLHTIKGSARMVDIYAIGTLTHNLETLLGDVTPETLNTHPTILNLAQRTVDSITEQVHQVEEGGPVAHSKALLHELEKTNAIVKGQPVPETLPTTASDPVETTINPSEITEEFETIEGEQELQEIFLEEAKGYSEQLDEKLQEWIANPNDFTLAAHIKRTLHTLKGGARLAGIQSIGTLSHTLETLLDGLNPEIISSKTDLLALARRAADFMAEQLDQVEKNVPVAYGKSIVHELESNYAQLTGKALPDTPVPPTPKPTPKPSPIGNGNEDKPGKPPRPTEKVQPVKVQPDLLNRLISNSGEINIYRARLEEHNTASKNHIEELNRTVTRLNVQLRNMTLETEAQIRFRKGNAEETSEAAENPQKELDPLELDR